MPFPRDRAPTILEQRYPAYPLPPLNVFATSGLEPEVVDVRWTSPAELQDNTCGQFDLLGVNLYRSFDSDYGPYFRLNTTPLGATQWRDRTRVVLAMQEDVSGSFTARGAPSDPHGRYMFRTRFRPIVIYPSPGSANCTNLNVQVTVNGVPAFVERIFADTGIVELRTTPTFDVTTQQQTLPVLPTSGGDVVLATYKYVADRVRTDLAQRIFYRVTTVGVDKSGNLVETPLERATQSNRDEVEKLDYIWTEAIRRNLWIRFQGGERVKLFVRKAVGPRCGCSSSVHKQPSSDCLVCYGTGVLGGYDGPFDTIIAPDDAAKKIAQTNRGRTVEHSYETWTGPRPLLSQRDFIVKLNGDRYGIGPVRMPSNRGMQLQQMFSIGHLDEQDIRYKVPLFDPLLLEAPQTRYLRPDMIEGGGGATPMVTEKATIQDGREIRGSTVTFENIEY